MPDDERETYCKEVGGGGGDVHLSHLAVWGAVVLGRGLTLAHGATGP